MPEPEAKGDVMKVRRHRVALMHEDSFTFINIIRCVQKHKTLWTNFVYRLLEHSVAQHSARTLYFIGFIRLLK
jgi:hypothetical protein